jgi:hypothetical protein
MSRSKNTLKDTFCNIEKEARRRGLLVNENKTKYMQGATAVHNDDHCVVDNINLNMLKKSLT